MVKSGKQKEVSVAAEPSARARLVEAASRLFCRYGINAVGVDAVVAEAGTAKATLYKAFGSKEKLVEVVLEQEGMRWRDWFLSSLEEGTATPIERLRRIFPLLGQWFAQERFYGCPFINAIGEHDKGEERLRRLTIAHTTVVLQRIEQLAREAGSAEPMKLAHQIGLLIDGAIVVAMVTRDADAARLAGEASEQLIASLIGRLA